MKLRFISLACVSFFLLFGSAHADKKTPAARKGKSLVNKMVKTVGSYKKLIKLEDVEYTYTYGDIAQGETDVSIERYVFDGELSWGKYTRHDKTVMPDQDGIVVQGYDGRETWATLNGKPVTNRRSLKKADFLRKTNFYWFAMMQKMLDPGLIYRHEGSKNINGTEYALVKITFKEDVGDVQDTYVLYINPETKLVDQFLFTVMDFGMANPLLMKVEYENVAGLKLPAKRKYTESNWEGEIKGKGWTHEVMTDIRFTNGFSKSLFQKPY